MVTVNCCCTSRPSRAEAERRVSSPITGGDRQGSRQSARCSRRPPAIYRPVPNALVVCHAAPHRHPPRLRRGLPARPSLSHGKYPALMAQLETEGCLPGRSVTGPSRPPPWRWRAPTTRSTSNSSRLRRAREDHAGDRFPVTERVSRRAQLAQAAPCWRRGSRWNTALPATPPGGSHHARHAHGAGFCTFNDVAVAALDLIASDPLMRILVVDLDVHQGDGTAEILAGEHRAFTFSMPCAEKLPCAQGGVRPRHRAAGRHGGRSLSRHARRGTGPAGARGPLDLVFYNAGVDPHREDRLGRLSLSDEGLAARDGMVIERFRRSGTPVCGVIGGGYSRDIAALAARHAILFRVAETFAEAISDGSSRAAG